MIRPTEALVDGEVDIGEQAGLKDRGILKCSQFISDENPDLPLRAWRGRVRVDAKGGTSFGQSRLYNVGTWFWRETWEPVERPPEAGKQKARRVPGLSKDKLDFRLGDLAALHVETDERGRTS